MHPWMEGVHSALRTATWISNSTTSAHASATLSSAASSLQPPQVLGQLIPAYWHGPVQNTGTGRCGRISADLEAGAVVCDATTITQDPPVTTTGGASHSASGAAGEPGKLRQWRFGEAYDRRIRLAVGLGWTTAGGIVLLAAWNFMKFASGVKMPQLSKPFL